MPLELAPQQSEEEGFQTTLFVLVLEDGFHEVDQIFFDLNVNHWVLLTNSFVYDKKIDTDN